MIDKGNRNGLFTELRERQVFKVSAIYAVVAWVLVQVCEVVFESFDIPASLLRGIIILAVIGFPVAATLAWIFDLTPQGIRRTSSRKATRGRATPEGSIAVLPFLNLSDDPSQDHFVMGICEDLLTSLQSHSQLLVVSRNSSFVYKDQSVDIRQVGEDLNVRYVLEGSVRKVENRVRITAQLINAATDHHMWAQNYDRELSDIFALQDEITQEISTTIAAQLETDTPEEATSEAIPEVPAPGGRRRLVWGTISVAVLALTGYLGGAYLWVSRTALPDLSEAVSRDDNLGAWRVAERIRGVFPLLDIIPDDLGTFEAPPIFLETNPEGAEVYWRGYQEVEAPWVSLGQTPIQGVSLPAASLSLRIEKEGYAPLFFNDKNPSLQFSNVAPDFSGFLGGDRGAFDLIPEEDLPAEMVYVPAGQFIPAIVRSGTNVVPVEAFLIDKSEVSNLEFKEFVDAGGYSNPSFWTDMEFDFEGDLLDWEDALDLMVDATGQPGPATWEFGSYKPGTDDHPVTGISWYEATAYAQFREKSLPTFIHWTRAAYPPSEIAASLMPSLVGTSNFNRETLHPVGSEQGGGAYGSVHQAGNAREWILNSWGQGGMTLGGSYREPTYWATQRVFQPHFSRSDLNGLRLIKLLDPEDGASFSDPISRSAASIPTEPVSDETYEVISAQFVYSPTNLEPEIVEVDDSDNQWIRETVRINTGYDGESIEFLIYIPKGFDPPYQPVMFSPGANAYSILTRLTDFDPAIYLLDFLPVSGRALVIPAFDGSYERKNTEISTVAQTPAATSRALAERRVHWRIDLGRLIDYFTLRPDLDHEKVIYLGFSYGASSFLASVPFESRIQNNIFISGGGATRNGYLNRIMQPTLMLNGSGDFVFPVRSQELLFERLGTPAEDKRHVVMSAGHFPLPRNQMVGEISDWLDKYLGQPVRSRAAN
jgi:TolB-like protein